MTGWTWSRSPAPRRAGKRIMQLAAGTVKRVALELGGKSANLMLEDADLAVAVPAGLFSCYLNSGQTCSALTRMIVPLLSVQRGRSVGHQGGIGLHTR